MIAHVLLFRPLPSLTSDDRRALVSALERALTDIPLIRRASVGQRRRIGRPYEQLMREDYPLIATLEFDDEASLRAYLDHPAHAELADRFFRSVAAALVYDFEMTDAANVRQALAEL